MTLTGSRLPAILIGGPPRAGKSVLAHSLKEALTQHGIEHYLLRAAPDGEGDWFQQADRRVAQAHRRKGAYTSAWVEQMRHDIATRPLPFLVDVGGRPTAADEAIFDQCTHAILLVKGAESEALWQALINRHNLPLIAQLTSVLNGESTLTAERPIIRGTISGLERGQPATGPVFGALVGRVKALFDYSRAELFNIHQQQAPTDLVVDLPRLHRRLHPQQASYRWNPQDLPAVLNFLPPDDSLALYGRGPAWLYAAVAGYSYPHPFYQFDARRGWVKPVTFVAQSASQAPLSISATSTPAYLHLKLGLTQDYLEYVPALALPLPTPAADQGVVLDGKLPVWLYTGLATFYHQAPWLAIYYPQLNQAVVAATSTSFQPGQLIDLRPV